MEQVFKEQLEKLENVIFGILILYKSIYLFCEKNPTKECYMLIMRPIKHDCKGVHLKWK